jgi:hypothetical protein
MDNSKDIDAGLNEKQSAALKRLRSYGLFFYDNFSELDEDDDPSALRALNLNDTFWWATGYSMFVPDDKIEELDRLFSNYGWCGVLYWVSKNDEHFAQPEFNSVRRMISFVDNEERILTACKSSSEYAYSKDSYKIG